MTQNYNSIVAKEQNVEDYLLFLMLILKKFKKHPDDLKEFAETGHAFFSNSQTS